MMNGLGSLLTLPTGLLAALGVLVVLQVTLDAIAIVDLYKRPAAQLVFANKWLWLAIILLVSTIGAIIYLVAGRRGDKSAEYKPRSLDSSRAVETRGENAADLLYGKRKENGDE
jgi:hypothetical protein